MRWREGTTLIVLRTEGVHLLPNQQTLVPLPHPWDVNALDDG